MIANFIPGLKSDGRPDSKKIWLIFKGRDILLTTKTASIPTDEHFDAASFEMNHVYYLGKYHNQSVLTASGENVTAIPGKTQFMNTFQVYHLFKDEHFFLIMYAYHLLEWNKTSIYCGACGNATQAAEKELVKICPCCHTHNYPRISPAMIVAVTKADQILLGRARHFPPDFFSVLAGYAAPGENLEQCVAREVQEETGIRVKNIRYFASQPWGLSGSLMIGFTAEYARGEIVVDQNELAEARWFTVDNLPQLPLRASLSRQLIQWFQDRHSVKN